MKKFALLTLLVLSSTFSVAQMTGPTSGTVGQSSNYAFYGSTVYGYYTWSVSPANGYVSTYSRSGTIYYATIVWTSSGSSTVTLRGNGVVVGTINVSTACPSAATPNASFSYSGNTCGDKTISYTGSAPAGTTWYWQTSASGTSTSNSSNQIIATSSGFYYLRGYLSCNGTWTSAQSTANVTVNPIPGTGTPSASSTSLCGSGTVYLTGTGAGTNELYNWYNVSSGGSPIAQNQSISSTTTFYMSVYNTVSLCEGARTPITITVYPMPGAPTAGVLPATICGSGNVSFTATGAGTNETYRWYDVSGGGSPITPPASVSLTTTLYAAIYNTVAGCEGSRTAVTVTVNPLPVDGTISANVSSICLGQSITISSSGGVGTPYYWASTNGGGSWDVFQAQYVGQSSFSFTPTQPGTYRFHLRRHTVCGFCWDAGNCGAESNVDVVVHPLPNATAANSVICSGQTSNISITGSVPGTTFSWTVSAPNISGAASGSGTSISQTLGNATGTTQVATYTITPTANGCTGTPINTTVTVNPLPGAGVGSVSPASLCGPGTVTWSGSGAGTNEVYRWYAASTGGAPITPATSVSTSTTLFISRYNTVTGCEGSRTGVMVTVNAIPTLAGGSASPSVRCGPGTVSWSGSGAGANEVYRWYAASTGGAPITPATSVSVTTTNFISKYNTVTGCEGGRTAVTVTVHPLPGAGTGSVTPNAVCGSGSVTWSGSGAGTNEVYRWYAASTGGAPITPATSVSTTTINYVSRYNTVTGCEGSRTAVTITVNPAITTAPTLTGHSRFGTGTLTFVGSGNPLGPNYKWYTFTNTLLSTGPNYLTTSVSASATNFMKVSSISPAGCEGPQTTININVYPQPVVTAPQNYVTKEVPVTLTASAGNETYTWRNSIGTTVQTGASTSYNATLPDTYTVTAVKTGATSAAIPYTLNGPLVGVNMNYVVSNNVLIANVMDPLQVPNLAADKVTQTIAYFDGLGRPLQNVATQASPLKNDIVTPVKYDQYGRQAKEYLPYVIENSGRYKSNDLTGQAAFYNPTTTYLNKIKTDGSPWAETVFEASPLNRVTQKGAPGAVWQPNLTPANGKTIKMEYLVNVDGTSANQEKIKIWTLTPVTIGSKPEFIISSSAYYASNTLYVTVTKDEENRQVREYKDKQGKVILKKVQEAVTPAINVDNDWTLTYYIYDEFERLRFVLQPKFIHRNSIYDAQGTNDLKKGMLDSLTFEYRYDERGRMIYKRVPGAKQVDMVYDPWDRLVLSQDGNQKVAAKWSFTKYDILNRPIITGEIANANTRDQMVTAVNAITARNENTASGNGVGYTLNLTYPTAATINDIYTITYYDDYTFKTNLTLGTAYDAVIPSGFTGVVNYRVKNLVTGSKIRVLQSSPIQWLVTASYYDDRYRLLHSVGDDHLNNKNKITNEYYGLTPWITKSLLNHGTALTSLTETTYDHMGRIKDVHQTMDNLLATRTMIASHKYNELGELVEKNIHSTNSGSTFLQYNDYRYNIRGWLTHINNSSLTTDAQVNDNDPTADLFGMELKYNEIVSINGVNTKDQFNGNISAIQWKTNNLVDATAEKIYGFKYDPLNRLLDATYATKNGATWNANVNLFDENLTYDKNGNIRALKRKSTYNSGTTGVLIDDLVYRYKGNQLVIVDDTAPNEQYGFTEGSINWQLPSVEYQYDENGNMKIDQNKALVASGGGIVYNHLNLPVEVRFDPATYGQRKIVYTYDADGTKLRKIAYNNSGLEISRTDYVGGIQYESSVLKFMMTSEGRAVKNAGVWQYEYFHKDHLGNTRVVYGYQKQVDEYKATMETPLATKEQGHFYNLTTTRVTAFNRTPASIDVVTPDKSAETNGNLAGKAIGPAKMLQVAAGDRVQLEVFARYATGTGSNTTLISNLASAVTGSFMLTAGEAAHTAVTNNVPARAATITQTGGVPKAYLFYILFNSSYVYQQFGYVAVNSTALVGHQQMYLDITIPTGGFLYTYVANESNVSLATSVYFDDFSIIHTRSTPTLQVLQTTDYYPFGLAIAAQTYQKQSSLDNDYLYNGKELQDEHNLGWMDYGARMYMSDIGRWGVIDALSEKYEGISPYTYALDDPINTIDPDGNLIIFVNGLKPDQWRNQDNNRTIDKGGWNREPNPNYRPYPGERTFSEKAPTYLGQGFKYWGNEIINGHGDKFAGIGGLFSQIYNDFNTQFVSASSGNYSQGEDRFAEGQKAGEDLIKQIEDGNINLSEDETIKIVGHSQGAAFAAGILSTLAKHSKYSTRVEVVHYLSPHQPESFVHDSRIMGFQWSTQSDLVSSFPRSIIQLFNGFSRYQRIKGISEENFNEREYYPGKLGGHYADSWINKAIEWANQNGIPVYIY